MRTLHTTIGELIALLYAEFMEIHGDPDLASAAAAAVINDLLVSPPPGHPALDEAA